MNETAAFSVPCGVRRLFLDDFGVAKIDNLTRTMRRPDKKGAVIRPDCAAGVWGVQTRAAPSWDPETQRFRYWILEQPDELAERGIAVAGYYESADGLHWTRPSLRQVEHRGSLENHYARGGPFAFVRDPLDPDPARRYKGLRHHFDRLAPVSCDGATWKSLDAQTIPSWDEYNLSFDPAEKLFIATVKDAGLAATYKDPRAVADYRQRGLPARFRTYRQDATDEERAHPGTGRYGRSVWLTTSGDFRRWTPPELIFETDDLDQELARERIERRLADPSLQQPVVNDPACYNADVYNMGVFRYEGLYVGTPAIYYSTGMAPGESDNTEGFHEVQLACSRDLRSWLRLGGRSAFIGPSPVGAGAYDLMCAIGPSCPVVRGDELWFYYTGSKYRCRPERAEPDRGAICLAVLRRDGFVSLDAGEREGTIITEPFALAGGRLHVNVDAPRGELRVEVLGGDGNVLAESAPLEGDLTRGEVTWKRGDVCALAGQSIALRFRLRNASLYSYWLL